MFFKEEVVHMKLTLPQKQIYYMDRFSRGSISVNCGSVLINHLYDIGDIQKAINDVYRINEALRTRISFDNGEPYQYVTEYKEKQIEVVEFNSKEKVHEYGKKMAQKPIDLKGELCEIKVISSEDFCGIFYKVHHIISDAFTLSLLASQIHKILEGEIVQAFPYSDYIIEEEKYLLSNRAKKDREYFINQYNNIDDFIYLCDTPPEIGECKRKIYLIDSETTSKVKEFAKNKNTSPYTVFLTLTSTYVSRIKNYPEKLFVGTTVLNRTSVSQMNTAGIFVNNVPYLAEIEADKSFAFNLSKVQDNVFNLLKHQRFNYICAINETGKRQVYDISLSFQTGAIYGENFESAWYHNGFQTESLQIHIDDRDNAGVFNITYDYQIDKFNDHDIDILHQRLMSLLTDALDNEDKALYELNCLTDSEKNMVLKEFIQTAADYPKDKCIHTLFEELAEKTSEQNAVVAHDKILTYRELNEESNKIAHALIEKGIGVGDIVAFSLMRKSYLIAAIFGILKSGAAYLPIDPDYPESRIEYILSDSEAKCLITDDHVIDWLKNDSISNPKINVSSESPCYCIYTSGSTGRPKGTIIRHRNLMNFCSDNAVNCYQNFVAHNCSNILSCGAITFDISSAEIMLALILNKTIVLANEADLSNTNQLAKLFNHHRVDCVLCTPTKLHTYLINDSFSNAFADVKCVLVAGEHLTEEVYNTIKKHCNAKIFNGYGPTETTMGVCFGEVNDDIITIGKPIANTQIYIVDKYMNPVPIGVTGELCIAGDCVGAGYLNRPELTEEKFIDNPFGEGKLYKTGDIGYWREDGNIVFVGRNDFQVKVRGLRIELGEIENIITRIDGINMSVVVVRKDNQDRQLICAFYTGEEKSAKELREEIGRSLPKYMIPHIFTHLEKMPMTSSGKTDRNALPEIELENISTETEIVAPETQEEKTLAGVVCSVLRRNSINMLDNFFNIGGDSIKAIYIVSELEEMGYELHISDVMQNDTLSDVAKVMKSTSNKAIYDQNEVNGLIPFSPIMRAFLNENNTIPKDFVHTCIVSADCDEDTARKALDVLVSHHDILRGTFCDNGIEIYPSNEKKVYSFKEITIDDTDKAKEYLNNISIDDNKLVNVVFCNTEKENLISITIHHFLIDLVSWEVFMKDFQTVIKQLKNNEEISLPAKTASFMMWNEELQKYSETISEESKEYWKNINEKLDNTKSLYSHEENENDAEEYSFTFDKNISNKLINEANNAYGTRINEVLLTALGLAARKIADGSVGIIVESHGRAELHKPIAIERTIGWFTSCYPIVIDNDNNVTDVLISTKETLRKIPKNGIDYLLLSQSFHKNADIIFNFYKNSLADEDRKNKLIAFNSGTSVYPGKINVNCIITNAILTVNISVPKCKHKQQISEELGMEFVKQIQKIIDICTTTDTVIKTRSDFSDDELTEIELDELKDLFDWIDDDE